MQHAFDCRLQCVMQFHYLHCHVWWIHSVVNYQALLLRLIRNKQLFLSEL